MPRNPAVHQGRPPKKKRRKQDPVTGPKEIMRQQRVLEICELRKQGWPVAKIAVMQKLSRQRVDAIIRSYFSAVVAPVVEEVRSLELERLDELQAAHWTAALDGNPVATDRVLDIMARRAQLLGLNAPEKTQFEEVGKLAEAKTQVEDAKADLLAKLNTAAQRLRIAENSPPAIEHEAIEATLVESKTVN